MNTTTRTDRDGIEQQTAPGADFWLEKARSLRAIVEEYRDQAEEERRLPQPVFDAMQAAGFFRMWLPSALGGYEEGEEALIRVIEEVSRYDASAGWNLAIGVESGAVWAYLPDATARQLRNADLPLAGSVNPARSTSMPVPGGYRVTGRWPFASGCHQAGWLMGAAAVINEPGRPQLYPNGEPVVRNFVMRSSDCRLLDTWHVTGLRGTGSCDFVAEDVFVPEDRQFIVMGPEPTKAFQPAPIYSVPISRLFGFALAAVGLGIARDAIDSFRAVSAEKRPFGARTVLDQQHSVHLRVGQAEAILRASRELLHAVARETDGSLRAGSGVNDDLFASAMLARAQAAAAATQAVDLILDCAGTSGVFEGSRLERCSRDIRMIPRHIYLSSSNLEMAGQYLIGGPLALRR